MRSKPSSNTAVWRISLLLGFTLLLLIPTLTRADSSTKIPAAATRRFWFYYQSTAQGWRVWYSLGASWFEAYPDRTVRTFQQIRQIQINGMNGTLIRKDGDSLEIFIPDASKRKPELRFRAASNDSWHFLGEPHFTSQADTGLRSFQFYYPFDAKGERYWHRQDASHWVEKYPTGQSTDFYDQGPVIVDGISGRIAIRSGDHFEVFIPDSGQQSELLRVRWPESHGWQPLAEITPLKQRP